MGKAKDTGSTPWQVGALVTIAVALIGAFATIYSQGGIRRTQDRKSDESLRSLYEAEVKSALNASRIAVDEAFTKLDPEPLHKSYSGYALATNVDAIRRLSEQGAESVELDYLTIRIDAVDIFDKPLHARVRETIKKTVTVHRAGHCERTLPFESKVTLYLKHTAESSWLIYSVEEDKENPSYAPCP
jgi:hypothetical protein